MKNQKPGNSKEEISLTNVRRLIRAIALLQKLQEKEQAAKLTMAVNTRHNYYPDVRYSFSQIEVQRMN